MLIANFTQRDEEIELEGLWQYDYGQKLQINGLDLPAVFEVHFAYKGLEKAIPQTGYTQDGVSVVDLPNSALAQPKTISAYIYLSDASQGETTNKILLYMNKRIAPEGFETPEDVDLFHHTLEAVNEYAERTAESEKSAEAWVHGHEDYPEREEDNAAYYAGVAGENAGSAHDSMVETQHLAERVHSDADATARNAALAEQYKAQAAQSAANALLSEQAAKASETAAQEAQSGAETAEGQAELFAAQAEEDKNTVEQAKAVVMEIGQKVADNKKTVEQTVDNFELLHEQAVADINNAGQAQTERVNEAGETAVDNIEFSRQQAAQSVTNEGTTQVANVQAAAEEITGKVEQIDQNTQGITELKSDLVYSIGEGYNEITELSWEEGYFINRYGHKQDDIHGQISVINVKAGERYHLIGYNVYHLSLYCLYETLYDRTNIVVYPKEPDDTDFSKRLLDVYIEIPEGYNYLVISQWISHNLENFHLYKYGINDLKNVKSDISEIKSDKFEYNNITSCIIENQIKNDFAWKEFDGLYATITFDDTNTDIDQLQDLAEELGIPFCYATIPSRLGKIMSQGTETAKQVLERAVANGGEVLSHWGSPLNSLSTDEDYYNVYVGAKKTLMENGFEVNGIITAGGGAEGTPQSFKTQNFLKDIELARIYYKYADLTANNFVSGQDLRHIEQFYNSRTFTDGGVDFMKSKIDAMVSQGSGWLNMASHGTNNHNTPSIDAFREIFQYAIDNGFTFVTWGEMYDKFKSSKLEERIKALELN